MWNLKDRNKVIGTQDKVIFHITSDQLLQKTPQSNVPDQASYQNRRTLATLFLALKV